MCVILPSPAYENRRIWMPAFQIFPRKFPWIFHAFFCHGEDFCVVKFVNLPGPDFSSCFGAKGQIWWSTMVDESPVTVCEKATSFLFFCGYPCVILLFLFHSQYEMTMILNSESGQIRIYTYIQVFQIHIWIYIYMCIYINVLYISHCLSFLYWGWSSQLQ